MTDPVWGDLKFEWMERGESSMAVEIAEPEPETLPPPQRVMEPPSILQIAEWMRDNVWLDIHVATHGNMERVRILKLTITFEHDYLEVEQRWFNKNERVQTQRYDIDLEDCWNCRPTTVQFLDVTPFGDEHEAAEPESLPADFMSMDEQAIVDAVLDGLCLLFNYLDRDELMSCGADYRHCHHRHQAIIAIYEMTNLSPMAICRRVFRYRSPTPWTTAEYKTRGDSDHAKGMRGTVVKLDVLVQQRLGRQCRRVKPFPRDYKPVLTK